jgi:hypothetical protein
MDAKLKLIISEGLKNSGFSKFWFMAGGSVNFIRKVTELREMVPSCSKAAWNEAFEKGVLFSMESKELEEWRKENKK